MRVLVAAGCVGALLVSSSLSFGAVVVGGSLLSPGDANQIETWIGQGPITLTNIYTKQNGQTSIDFHNAVDGQGRTVSVFRVFDGIASQLIGGYNPQSWTFFDGYHFTPLDAQRTAFIFNLTVPAIQRQNLIGEGAVSSGEYQSYNFFTYGPTFGGGHDLTVDFALTTGGAHNYSYGGTSGVDNILNGLASDSTLEVGALEVYLVTPEPVSAIVWGLVALVGFGAVWHKRRGWGRRSA
jgi:hypothetical protein